MSSDISGNLVIAGIFNDTLTMGDLEMISMEEYHNFITKIHWTGTTGKNEISRDENIQIFPNPGNDKIEITISNNNKILFFQLIDRYGRKIKENRVQQNGQFTVDISDLSTGLYFFYFYTKNGTVISKKIIVI